MQSQTTPQTQIKNSYKVAVIGAGAAGLVAARELRHEGHQVVVFERNNRIGGTWVYDPATDSDPLSVDPSRTIVHSSLYDSLRTNLPREVMGFRDYPFVAKDGEQRDPRRFPGHREVLHYLEDFTSEFKLSELIRYETEVIHVELLKEEEETGNWVVRSRRKDRNVEDYEVYNVVVVCNGHYTVPRVAEFPGSDVWPGEQIHSHNYRVPDPFAKKVVVLIGSSHSAYDISREIARRAIEVHVASRSDTSKTPTRQHGFNNLWLHSMIMQVTSAHQDGSVVFEDGSLVHADVILHCTGYMYDFPFLETSKSVTVDDNRVGPLYKHIFPHQLAPSLSFIGLPWKVGPFPLYELQSKWMARILSGQSSLPSQENMISDVQALYSRFEAAGVPKRYAHNIWDYQLEYYYWLAAQCGVPPPEEWRIKMFEATGINKVVRPETYRDEWEDQNLISEAHKDFLQYMPPKGGCKMDGHKHTIVTS
ncbi:Flavin-containing monooxygenase fmo gs-ox-like [Thalictrum thalictroides]|uniref:Flavin-containing monooxygenase n=1 Tax=Thalictrum thalictroides TaxID=46969 RepID=A0A7J6XE51_THATH|nr:Flavin-containing monooxygenase fmo gs-ox-like [Thalictrum thalictroides]